MSLDVEAVRDHLEKAKAILTKHLHSEYGDDVKKALDDEPLMAVLETIDAALMELPPEDDEDEEAA